MAHELPHFKNLQRRLDDMQASVKATVEQTSTGPLAASTQEIETPDYGNLGLMVLAATLALASVVIIVCLISFLVKKRKKVLDAKKSSFVVLPGSGPVRTSDIQFTLPTTCLSPESRSPSLASRKSICSEFEFKESSPILGGRYRSNSMQCGLGSINPDIYKSVESLLLWNNPEPPYPDDHLGRVWYALEYNKEEEKLIVSVVKAKNLPSRSLGAYYCDPYVRIWLMPDDRRHHQSKQKLKTCNPVFDETFVFQVPMKELSERIIKISVYDGGRSRKMREIGQVIYPLHKFNPDYSMSTWADLKQDSGSASMNDLGEIRLGMMYNDDLHRLSVNVMECKRIQPSSDECSLLVKLTLHHKHKLVKSKKTKAVTFRREPGKYEFNEGFNFKLQGDSLATSNLNIMVYQVGPGKSKEKQLGRVNIGSFMFARGRALAHWDDTITNPKKTVQRWHSLME